VCAIFPDSPRKRIFCDAGNNMNDATNRMTAPEHPPTDQAVAHWIGKRPYAYWTHIRRRLDDLYPQVFSPGWLYGGKKHGWSFRYKKNKAFCTLIPEKNRFALLIVFGAKEREKVEAIKDSLCEATRKQYDEATTYADGKWLVLTIDNDRVVEDVVQLWAVKRKPKMK